MDSTATIMVTADGADPRTLDAARQLASRLALPYSPETKLAAGQLALVMTGERLELRDHESRRKGIFADLASIDPATRASRGARRQPLARAFGRNVKTIVDATAGMGHDAALLAFLGFQVTAIERSAVIAALLADGLRRALADERMTRQLDGRLTIMRADVREALASMSPRPDAVYLDPMFPPKRKASSLARKSIRLIRAVVGDDPDAEELLAAARAAARDRVVVKRPSHAGPLAAKPSLSIEGTLMRYDVYLHA